jgi:methylenetetrahydrofolate dehydrogenase (NADP+)/methenyltetrahydrofolate cyclohydrolase
MNDTSDADLIDGRELSQAVRDEVRADIQEWTDAGHRPPFLSAILVGDNPASEAYVRGKEKDAAEVGIETNTHHLDADTSQPDLLDLIYDLNADPSVDGILVQLPLPDHIDEQAMIDAVDPGKDVDGFHPENLGRLMRGTPRYIPATPYGIMQMLSRSDIDPEGMDAVIVGRSNIVGKPLANLLLRRTANATVTVCHSRTQDLAAHTERADLLVAAAGQATLIDGDMVKEGAVVIDVGINRVEDTSTERGYRLVGDVDFDEVRPKASGITPVPGGVGLMTRAMLLKNTVQAARLRAQSA